MPFQFFTEYPTWYLIFCLAAAFLYSFVLYRSGHTIKFDNQGKLKTYLLWFTRFASVFFICFLLLNPLLKSSTYETDKPKIILAVDNSQSIMNQADSAVNREEILKLFKTLEDRVGQNAELETYVFGDRVKPSVLPDFTDKQTDLSNFLKEINSVYSGSNVGGMLLVTDGIFNNGINPAYQTKNLKFPVYTVGLGDTILKKDLKISNVRTNSIAYLNNNFPAVIDVTSIKCKGQTFKVTVYQGQEKVFEQSYTSGSDMELKTIEVELEAKRAGVNQYTVNLTQLKNEVTWLNNRKDFFIDVLDARQKILLLGNSPHPDLSALRQSIESNVNYQVEVKLNGFPPRESLKSYDLILLHQMPSGTAQFSSIQEMIAQNVPLLFIVGRQSNLSLFNALKTGITYRATGAGFNQTTALLNTGFNFFETSESFKSNITNFPPLSVPFGSFSFTDKNNTLLYQQIGSVNTEQSLVGFAEDQNNRYGLIAGEGFWRWRLIDYERNNNHEVCNELIGKIAQYLVARNDKRKFRVRPVSNTFFENENLIFNAEYYNQSYELVNKPEIKLILTNEEGKNYDFTFSRTNNAYKLNAGMFAPGSYSYQARILGQSVNESANGKIIIKPLQLEFTETTANHEVLKQISANTNGEFTTLSGLEAAIKKLISSENVKPVMYEQQNYSDLVHKKWVFFLILFLVSLEWFIRKRNGAY
ncbi:MAG: VWA domain-containing protein [Flavobacteriales bacterium]|nr:VWA domain-containing protein [Flavobacteriales bacterium]